jgi:tryptophan 2,3-dioxygenase
MTDNPADSPGKASGAAGRPVMSYSDYLQLDKILNAQQPLSRAHDETLFIIQHQTSELWMKLAIHELTVTCALIAADDLQPAFKALSRVSRILEQLNSAWDVLRTMTPSEYTEFRGALGQSSGLQSWQYRMIEFLVGNRNAAVLSFHAHDQAVFDRLDAARRAPSLYDVTIRLLAHRGLPIDRAVLERDVSSPYAANASVSGAWLRISPKSWSTSRIISAAGVLITSPRSNVSSVSSAAPAALPASPICARCSTSCCFPNSGS